MKTILLSILMIVAAAATQTATAQASQPMQTQPVKVQASVKCEKDLGFAEWLQEYKQEALASGISEKTLAAALPHMVYDANIVKRDKNAKVFQQSFLMFSDRMANADRILRGTRKLTEHKDIFEKIEKEYGVPPAVIASYWGLETDFGAVKGKMKVLSSVTTLAYDCRRAAQFRYQLTNLLKVVERGDIQPKEMIGGWSGELGGFQFMPEHYLNYAVDYDGDGKRDLINSVPDQLASAANLIRRFGWKAGEPWLESVRLPEKMAWEEADLQITHPRSQWHNWGVAGLNGPITIDDKPASLHLTMGRLGPGFLAYKNFEVFMHWNRSSIYSTTAAYLATRIAGAEPLNRGRAEVKVLDTDQIIQLQKLLKQHGYTKDEPDGLLGWGMRAAIKKAQLAVGLPADSYPSLELINELSRR